MSVILVVSILIRTLAMVWSIVLWRRIRDWRMWYMTLLLFLMAARQVATLIVEIAKTGQWRLSLPGHIAELPGLLVSVMAFLAIFFIERMLTDRKRTEEELQKHRDVNTRLAVIAEERGELQEWINTFDTFAGKFDPGGVGIIFNETPIRAGGVTKDEVVGRYFPDTKWWSHSEIERARIVECLERAKGGLSSRIETNFRSADGTPVPIIFNCQPVMDDEGKVHYITAEGKTIIEETLLRAELQEAKEALETRVRERTSELVEAIEKLKEEIGERKRAEEHIQHLQSVLKAIRNINQLIVHEKNQQKLLQGACKILNQTRDYKLVWIGLVQEGTKVVLPAAQTGFEEGYIKSVKITWDDSETGKGPTGTAIKTKKPFVIRDIVGDPRYKPWKEEATKRGYVSSAAVPLIHEDRVFGALNVYATIPDSFDEEEIDLLVEVSQDIGFALYTIEIEDETKRTKEFLQSIIDNTSDLICTVDLEGNFLSINRAVTERIGYKEEDLIGKPKRELVVDPERFDEAFRYLLEKGRLSAVEVRFRGKDGTIADILYSMTLLRDKDGHPIAVAGLGKDITERKRAEEELRKYREHLEELIKVRTRELEEKAIELNQANIQLKELDKLKSMFIASMSHELRTPLNSIIGFTGIILQGMAGEITKEQEKQLTMVKNSANHLLALINDVIDVSKIEAGKVELDIEEFDLSGLMREVKSSFEVITADKGLELFLDVPETLVIKSDERRAKQVLMNLVSNAVKFADRGKIKMKVVKNNGEVEMSVSDTGIGIRKGHMKMLFRPFSQICVEGRPMQEGTGLGLYLSKKIADLLGGELKAESMFEMGSEFVFSLPLKYKEAKT